jgi:hypothetical protein
VDDRGFLSSEWRANNILSFAAFRAPTEYIVVTLL